MQTDGSAVGPACIELNDPSVFNRIVSALYCSRLEWIGDQQTTAAGYGADHLAIIATCRVVRNDRYRCVEAHRVRIPGRLLDSQAKSRRQNRWIYRDREDLEAG